MRKIPLFGRHGGQGGGGVSVNGRLQRDPEPGLQSLNQFSFPVQCGLQLSRQQVDLELFISQQMKCSMQQFGHMNGIPARQMVFRDEAFHRIDSNTGDPCGVGNFKGRNIRQF